VNQQLAIVGGSTRAAAFSALRDGFTPLAADVFADADLARHVQVHRVAAYPRGLAAWLRTTPAGIPWMYTGGLENHPDLVDEMAAVRPLVGCRGDVLRRIRDPRQLADVFAKVGVAFPDTIGVTDASLSQVEPRDQASWLIKTYRGSSGAGVANWQDWPEAVGQRGPCFLQRRVEGRPGSAIFVAARGEARVLGTSLQLVGTPWTNAGDFQYTGSIGPWHLDEGARDELERAGQAVASLGVEGLFGIDFVRGHDDGRLWVIEANPRYTASVEIVEWTSGVSAITLHLAAWTGSLPAAPAALPTARATSAASGEPPFRGKAILFARRKVRVLPQLARWALNRAIAPDWPELADVPQPNTTIHVGRPVLTVFAAGESLEQVQTRLQSKVEEVEKQLYSVVPDSSGGGRCELES
jgi:predicted ATP-grasp superfamily ATP-dependent carboligase